MTLDARKVANEITADGFGVGKVGIVAGLRCLPPRPSMTKNVTALGNHVMVSYLSRRGFVDIIVLPMIGANRGRTNARLDTRRM
jgi:hypothetical protein